MRNPTRIGVLVLGQIGDALLSGPLFDALRTTYADAEILGICSPANAAIVRHHPAISDIIIVRNSASGLIDALGLLRRSFDLWVDPKAHRSTTSKLLLTILRYQRAAATAENIPILRRVTRIPSTSGHFIEGVNRAIEVLGLVGEEPRLRLALPQSLDVDAGRGAEVPGHVLINLSTRTPGRRWKTRHWAGLIANILKTTTYPIGLITVPSEADFAKKLVTKANNPRVYRQPTASILEAAAFVRDAVLVVTPDTAIVHIAAVYDRPVLGLYAGDDDNLRRFAPLSTIHEVVQADDRQSISSIDLASAIDAFGRLEMAFNESATT